MPVVKRPRRFASETHYEQLAIQMWANDWHSYSYPVVRIMDWAAMYAAICSGSRIGEYFESTCRSGSGRGLRFRDVKLVVFYNEEERPELGLLLVRDAKGMTYIPHQRPKHVIYEGIDSGPLFRNGMLFHIAFLLAKQAIAGCETIDTLFARKPNPGDNISIIPWVKGIEDDPFYPNIHSNDVERAGSIASRIRALGFRAGFANPPRAHDFRASTLYRVGKLHSEADRRIFAGQSDNRTWDTYYAPRIAADGQGSVFRSKRGPRTNIIEHFLDLTILRNPALLQALPAESRAKFEESQAIQELRAEMEKLQHGDASDPKRAKKIQELYQQRRRLEREAVRELQAEHSASTAEATSQLCYHRSYFDRVRYLMPERDRLATDLFQSTGLRGELGHRVLRDLIAICTQTTEVQFRRGLEPDKCNCNQSEK
ncbi:uncharacterized protein B0I36DRAFT_249983, partial [Microdochium trichocladiopsis]